MTTVHMLIWVEESSGELLYVVLLHRELQASKEYQEQVKIFPREGNTVIAVVRVTIVMMKTL